MAAIDNTLPQSPQAFMQGVQSSDKTIRELHDIELPVQVGVDPVIFKIVALSLLFVLIALLLFFTVRYFRRKKKIKGGSDQILLPPPLPHDQAALRELDAIRELMEVHPRLYYFRLTALLKVFIGKSFRINAPEMTAQELISALQNILPSHMRLQSQSESLISLNSHNTVNSDYVEKGLFTLTKELFDNASMIKYAAQDPKTDQMNADDAFARYFIDRITLFLANNSSGDEGEGHV
ncbi:conserved hypothetical protein [Desulfamplus magnetovallimortis]|uniref:DUF4381 domain-containing protein n=1 Tax=Desulfamplus magnetovallimortis TaxID=1246637 RepID=A0A1W1HDG1_9BACT|nr:DUF4381 family protein [Desulfamplus magnetovallimortis]SLM30534.1 conserved hypothetical protein [Desulfamplus magnetovallimortis]